MKDYAALVSQCDEDIRSGRASEIGKRLATVNAAQVPRAFRLPLANICRRAGLYPLGMALLAKVIHPQRTKRGADATPKELAEYGVLLLRAGAITESRNSLLKVDATQVPEALLFRAFYHFTVFEYEAAVPLVERYLLAPMPDYQKLVGQTNLAFALVGSGLFDRALPLLDETVESARANGHSRLESNCHAMRAEVFLTQGRFDETRSEVRLGLERMGTASTIDQMFLRKWISLLEGIQGNSLAPIESYRALALASNDWNGVREADRYALKIDFQTERFNRLIFGTPYRAYRERVMRELGRRPEQESYLVGERGAPVMDLATAEVAGQPLLNPGRKCHQLLEILLRDLYQPLKIGGLFFELFPGAYFDLASSPDRVHQIIRRTRRWLESSALPISIDESGGFFSLRIDGPFAFELPLERKPVESMALRLERLSSKLGETATFSMRDAVAALEISRFTFQALMKWAIDAGKVERLGSSNLVKYRFKGGSAEAAASATAA